MTRRVVCIGNPVVLMAFDTFFILLCCVLNVAESPGFFESGVLPWARLQKDAGTIGVGRCLATYLAHKKELEENRAGHINGERRSGRTQFVDQEDRKISKKLRDR